MSASGADDVQELHDVVGQEPSLPDHTAAEDVDFAAAVEALTRPRPVQEPETTGSDTPALDEGQVRCPECNTVADAGHVDTGVLVCPGCEAYLQVSSQTRSRQQTGGPWTRDTTHDPLGYLPKLELPGFGEERPSCGDDWARFCSCCGHVKTVGQTCKQSRCPRCAPVWAREAATSICSRIGALRARLGQRRDTHQRYHHVVLSPPVDWALAADDPLERTIDAIREFFEVVGLEGVVFYHPWSGKADPDEEADRSDDRGAWKRRLFEERSAEDVREELLFRPHFHAIVVDHKVPGGQFTADLLEETGWLVHRITQAGDSDVSIGNDADLARAVTYCLSHTGLYDTASGSTRAAYRYLGAELNDVHVQEQWEIEHDRNVRAASPLTLGLEYDDMVCGEVVKETASRTETSLSVDLSLMAGRSRGAGKLGSSNDVDAVAGAGGDRDLELGTHADELPADGAAPDPPDTGTETDAEVDVEFVECEGRYLNIAKAREYLKDDDWRDTAAYASATLEAFQEAARREEWLDPLDDDLREELDDPPD